MGSADVALPPPLDAVQGEKKWRREMRADILAFIKQTFQETLHVTARSRVCCRRPISAPISLVALPAGYFMDRKGYKAGILVGCACMRWGAAVRAGGVGQQLRRVPVRAVRYRQRLGCLETAANPYATVLGDAQGAERRLNLAQSFNGLGQFIGPLIGGTLFFSLASSPAAAAIRAR